jgi:hypothetical protein
MEVAFSVGSVERPYNETYDVSRASKQTDQSESEEM